MLGLEFALLDESRRVAAYDGPRLDVFEDGGTRTDYGTFADGDAHTDEGVGGDPCTGFNRNRGDNEAIVFGIDMMEFMSGRTQMALLRDGHVVAQRDHRLVITPHVRA
jgi:hypothetical protein